MATPPKAPLQSTLDPDLLEILEDLAPNLIPGFIKEEVFSCELVGPMTKLEWQGVSKGGLLPKVGLRMKIKLAAERQLAEREGSDQSQTPKSPKSRKGQPKKKDDEAQGKAWRKYNAHKKAADLAKEIQLEAKAARKAEREEREARKAEREEEEEGEKTKKRQSSQGTVKRKRSPAKSPKRPTMTTDDDDLSDILFSTPPPAKKKKTETKEENRNTPKVGRLSLKKRGKPSTAATTTYSSVELSDDSSYNDLPPGASLLKASVKKEVTSSSGTDIKVKKEVTSSSGTDMKLARAGRNFPMYNNLQVIVRRLAYCPVRRGMFPFPVGGSRGKMSIPRDTGLNEFTQKVAEYFFNNEGCDIAGCHQDDLMGYYLTNYNGERLPLEIEGEPFTLSLYRRRLTEAKTTEIRVYLNTTTHLDEKFYTGKGMTEYSNASQGQRDNKMTEYSNASQGQRDNKARRGTPPCSQVPAKKREAPPPPPKREATHQACYVESDNDPYMSGTADASADSIDLFQLSPQRRRPSPNPGEPIDLTDDGDLCFPTDKLKMDSSADSESLLELDSYINGAARACPYKGVSKGQNVSREEEESGEHGNVQESGGHGSARQWLYNELGRPQARPTTPPTPDACAWHPPSKATICKRPSTFRPHPPVGDDGIPVMTGVRQEATARRDHSKTLSHDATHVREQAQPSTVSASAALGRAPDSHTVLGPQPSTARPSAALGRAQPSTLDNFTTPCRRPVVLPATRPSSIPNLQPITLGRSHNQGSSADITPIMAPDVRDTSAPETGALIRDLLDRLQPHQPIIIPAVQERSVLNALIDRLDKAFRQGDPPTPSTLPHTLPLYVDVSAPPHAMRDISDLPTKALQRASRDGSQSMSHDARDDGYASEGRNRRNNENMEAFPGDTSGQTGIQDRDFAAGRDGSQTVSHDVRDDANASEGRNRRNNDKAFQADLLYVTGPAAREVTRVIDDTARQGLIVRERADLQALLGMDGPALPATQWREDAATQSSRVTGPQASQSSRKKEAPAKPSPRVTRSRKKQTQELKTKK